MNACHTMKSYPDNEVVADLERLTGVTILGGITVKPPFCERIRLLLNGLDTKAMTKDIAQQIIETTLFEIEGLFYSQPDDPLTEENRKRTGLRKPGQSAVITACRETGIVIPEEPIDQKFLGGYVQAELHKLRLLTTNERIVTQAERWHSGEWDPDRDIGNAQTLQLWHLLEVLRIAGYRCGGTQAGLSSLHKHAKSRLQGNAPPSTREEFAAMLIGLVKSPRTGGVTIEPIEGHCSEIEQGKWMTPTQVSNAVILGCLSAEEKSALTAPKKTALVQAVRKRLHSMQHGTPINESMVVEAVASVRSDRPDTNPSRPIRGLSAGQRGGRQKTS